MMLELQEVTSNKAPLDATLGRSNPATNKKLVVTSATLLVTGATLVVTRSY